VRRWIIAGTMSVALHQSLHQSSQHGCVLSLGFCSHMLYVVYSQLLFILQLKLQHFCVQPH
jgi:hypothetical protein